MILGETDPFSQVFTALWGLIDISLPINGYTSGATVVPPLVLPGNKIKLDMPEDRDPIKGNAQDADFPELMLATNGIMDSNFSANSCGSMIQRQYSWLLTTGDFRTNYRLFPVEWAVYCAMANWAATLAPLTYDGLQFVKRCRAGSAVEGVTDPRLNRNIRGWTSIWSCTVDFLFTREMLKLYNDGVQ